MVKVYIVGYFAPDNYKLWDVVENRSYFTDPDAALAQVRHAVIDHLNAGARSVRFLAQYCPEDFHKWMADNAPDVWYPATAAEFSDAFEQFLEDDDGACSWFVVVDVP